MTTYHNRIVSALLSIVGTVGLVAFVNPATSSHPIAVDHAQAVVGVARAAG